MTLLAFCSAPQLATTDITKQPEIDVGIGDEGDFNNQIISYMLYNKIFIYF